MKGGYINIDASGLHILVESAQTVTGLYEQLSHAMEINKPIFLCNVTAEDQDTSKVSPIYVTCYLMKNTNIICETSAKEIVVIKNDQVLIRNLVHNGGEKWK